MWHEIIKEDNTFFPANWTPFEQTKWDEDCGGRVIMGHM